MIRSILFVPADSERKLAKAAGSGADALVLDLEDAVLPERKPLARSMMQAWLLAQPERNRLWVRVNDVASGGLLEDLARVVPARIAGIMLPKIRGPEDVFTVGQYLDALEGEHGIPVGHHRIIALVTETPLIVLRLGEVAMQRHPRISHLSWGAEDLSTALGAGDPRTGGQWGAVYVHARVQCLLAAHAMGVDALETVYVDYKDTEGLRASCRAARHDGFTGRLAIHPDQVPIINECFTATDAERAHAERVVDAFKAGAGAASLDGRMIDIAHLRAARRILGTTRP